MMKNEDMLEHPEYIVKFILIILMIPFGISGNILVITAVWKKRSMRTTTNVLLVNLAASDLLTLIFGSFMLVPEITTLPEGTLSDSLCIFFISYNVPLTTNFVSIFTLTVLALERYHAVVKPMINWIRLREDTVKYACLGTWFVGVSLAMPFYAYSRYRVTSCRHIAGSNLQSAFKGYQLFLAVFIVLLPFFIISFCYSQILRELYFKNKVGPRNVQVQEEAQEKRKLFKTTVTVTFVFALFLFPYAITLGWESDDHSTLGRFRKFAAVGLFCSACINPLIYAFQSSNFRQSFKEILKPCFF